MDGPSIWNKNGRDWTAAVLQTGDAIDETRLARTAHSISTRSRRDGRLMSRASSAVSRASAAAKAGASFGPMSHDLGARHAVQLKL